MRAPLNCCAHYASGCVEIYVSSHQQHYYNEWVPSDDTCEPIGAEVATTILEHVKYLIAEHVSFGNKSFTTSQHEHEADSLSSGAWNMIFSFEKGHPAKSFFNALRRIFSDFKERGVKIKESTCDDTLLSCSVSIRIYDRTYFGHILVRLSLQ